ncbi:Mov34/MPN/PAD-1 family protein [Aquabacterium sp.]|uniref:Mov34/MPN/PAD-1 family protein n=1 Tax=Aquabacterium sp. TaxID=1872578 RepID=UPI00344E37DD
MLYVSSWSALDRRVLLSFSDAVIAVFQTYVQDRQAGYEAGGILMGTVHGQHMLVSEATQPTPHDRRSRFRFERSTRNHQGMASLRWRKSCGTVRYLGDWHTHPEESPIPSNIDRKEWAKLACQRQDGRPSLCVIVGSASLFVSLAFKNGAIEKLASIPG